MTHAELLMQMGEHKRKMAKSRREYARVSDSMTPASARESAKLASQMAGRRIPAGKPSEWKENARRDRAIAEILDAEATACEAGAAALRGQK